jgi:predicted Zn-dependent protease
MHSDARMTDGTPAQGFSMSGRRVAAEIALVLLIVVGGVAVVAFVAARGADRLTSFVPTSFDRTIGEKTQALVLATSKPCSNPEAQRYVEAVAAPLLSALGDTGYQFSFRVVESPEVNAFALPGGFVTVNSALLESAESGDEVAAVLAHELHHVTRRHGTRRMLRELGTSVALSAVFGGTNVAVPAKALHDLASNAYGRDEESEADALGLRLMVKAGIDPRGMSRFFERLARTSPQPPAILSTHPDPGDRAELAAKAAEGARVTTLLPSPRGVRCQLPVSSPANSGGDAK